MADDDLKDIQKQQEEAFAKYFGYMIDRTVEETLPHKISEVICVKCGKRWISVRPENVLLKHLQCPGCEQEGFVIETGQEIREGDFDGV